MERPDASNVLLEKKKQSKRLFRKAVRTEIAEQRNKERELILDTKTRDIKMFHKLVRNNRKKGNEAVVELDVNGEKYSGSDNIIHGFRQLATFNPETRLDEQYHNIVEDDINTINYLVQHKDIKNVSMDEINKATQSLNIKGKSADYHGLTIEHIIYAGKEIQLLAGLH